MMHLQVIVVPDLSMLLRDSNLETPTILYLNVRMYSTNWKHALY